MKGNGPPRYHFPDAVLSRNPNADQPTKEVLAYYQDILRTKRVDLGETADVNFSLIRG
jgi:hypothetical protein